MTEDTQEVPEGVAEYAEKEMGNEQETFEPINEAQLRANVRQLIDVAIQSGISQESVEDMLHELADGTQYYYEDAARYAQQE